MKKALKTETVMGGPVYDFPSTLWCQITCAGDSDAQKRRSAWDGLAGKYWKPVYAYIRTKWAKTNEEAKDLTQDFFAWMMETDFTGRADPRRGRFRAFVRSALDNYVRMDQRHRNRRKRGGSHAIFQLQDSEAKDWQVPDPAGRPAEEVLQDLWKGELLVRATRLLREAYEKEGKVSHFAVFQDYYLNPAPGVKHEEVAARHRISAADVNHYLMNGKQRFRAIVENLVAETVQGPEELREEMRELFGRLLA
jgi:RNA polymerase sigma-70 factor (ECF subfamily)